MSPKAVYWIPWAIIFVGTILLWIFTRVRMPFPMVLGVVMIIASVWLRLRAFPPGDE